MNGYLSTAFAPTVHSSTRRNHQIILDSTWGKLLHTRKVSGVYQISSRQLTFQLLSLRQVTAA